MSCKKKCKKMKKALRKEKQSSFELLAILHNIFESSYINSIEETDNEYCICFGNDTGVSIPKDNDGTKEGIMINLLKGVIAQIYHNEEMTERVFSTIEDYADTAIGISKIEKDFLEKASSASSSNSESDTSSSFQSRIDIYSKVKKLTQKEIEHHDYKTIVELANQLGITEKIIRNFFTDDFCKKYLRLAPDDFLVIKGGGCRLIKSSINNNNKGE